MPDNIFMFWVVTIRGTEKKEILVMRKGWIRAFAAVSTLALLTNVSSTVLLADEIHDSSAQIYSADSELSDSSENVLPDGTDMTESEESVETFVDEVAEEAQLVGTTAEEPVYNGNAYIITKASEFSWLASQVSDGNTFAGSCIELANDIDLDTTEWLSVGYNLNNYFAGTFNGNGHTISNFSASGSVDAYTIINAPRHTTGLFGVCRNAEIKNVVLKNASFEIKNESGYANSYSSIDGTNVYGGVLCGYAENTAFKNISVIESKVTVHTGAESAYAYAGGLVGYAKSCEFAHCSNEGGTVQGTTTSLNNDSVAGGLIGQLENEGTVRQCYNNANVYGKSVNSAAYTGGLIGKTVNNATTLSSIRDCYNKGQVYHTSSMMEHAYVGGLIGYSSSTVNRCYNSGIVGASSGGYYVEAHVGGIVGSGISSSSVANSCVAAPQIQGQSAYIVAGAGSKDNNIASTALSATNDASARYALSELYGSTLYADKLGWDFKYIWEQNESDYPTLQKRDADTEQDIILVDTAASGISINFASGDTYNHVTQDFSITQTGLPVEVSWGSSNEAVVATDGVIGVVNRQNDEYQVKITANISSGNYSVKKVFLLNVIGTASAVEEDSKDWGFKLEDARRFVAIMRQCPMARVDKDDPDVLVLTGEDIEEEHIIETMARVMEFWEVPGENAYLKSKMGDVVGLIKSQSDAELSSLVGEFTNGWIKYDNATDNVELQKTAIAKDMLKICEGSYETVQCLNDGIILLKKYSKFEKDDNPLYASLETGNAIGDVFSYVLKYSGDEVVEPQASVDCGRVLDIFKKAETTYNLLSALEQTANNEIRAYLNLYMWNRPYYDSPEDATFQAFMAAHNVTAIGRNKDKLAELAENLYQLMRKFGTNVEEGYKVTIMCPVDVSVYNAEGMLVGRVVENVVDTSVGNAVQITVGGENSDEKTIYVEDNEPYTVALRGTDEGVMNVEIETAGEKAARTYRYSDIHLEEDLTMGMDISPINETGEVPVIYDVDQGVRTENIIAADEARDRYLLNIIPCFEDKEGALTISTLGGYAVSDYVEPGTELRETLTINDGYILDGFYTNADCSERYVGSFMPEDTLTIYAKFSANTSGIAFLSEPEDAEYYVGDGANPLSVSIQEDGSYKYQWYSYQSDKDTAQAIDGATEASYTPQTDSEGETYYYVRVSAKSGEEENFLDSRAAHIRVTKKTFIDSGTCGENLTWTIDLDGTLRITGTGAMADYTDAAAPWSKHASAVKSLILEDGVTSVGKNAFSGMNSMISAVVPTTTEYIAEGAFAGCSALQEIQIPFVGVSADAADSEAVFGAIFGKVSSGGVVQYYKQEGTSLSGYRYGIPESLKKVTVTAGSKISFGAFYNCTGLAEIYLNEGIAAIAKYSFNGCTGLKDLIIPKSVTAIEEYALKGCNSLESLTVPFVGASRDANATYDSVFGHVFGRTSQSDSNYYVQYYNVEGTSLSGYGYAVPTALKKVTVTDADRIPIGAFSNLSGITELTINGGVSSVESFAFYKTSGLTDIYYQDTEAAWIEVPIGDGNEVLGNVVIHFLEEAPKEAAVIQAASLTLAGQIGVNIKMLLPDSIISDPDAYAVMSYNGGKEVSITIPVSEASVESGKYVFTCPVAVKEINDPVSIQLYYGDGTQAELVKGENLRVPVEGNCFQYAVSDYIAAKKGSTEEIGGLVRTMSDLGAAARIYFDYETEGAAIEADLSEVTAEDLQDYKMELTPAAAEGIKIYSASLDLESETSINVKFATTGDSFNSEDYTFTVDGEAVTPTVGLDGRYQIRIENITAKLLDDMFTITVSDKNGNAQAVRYGALSYAYSKLNSSKSGEKIKNLSKCLYLYSKAAEAYFN